MLTIHEGAFSNTGGTSAFGQPKPTGFSAFSGGTGAFGNTSTPGAFGQANTTPSTGTNILGQQSGSTANPVFGSTSAFGANKQTTSAFGSNPSTSEQILSAMFTSSKPFNSQ